MKCGRDIAGIVLSVTVLSSAAQATTMLALPTETLVHDAQVVAVVQVRSLETIRSDGHLSTRATLDVLTPVKGTRANDVLVARIPGGIEGKWVQQVQGAPVLREGEQCVVFLEPAGKDVYRFVGLEQGKLAIEPNPSVPGGALVRRTATARLVMRGPDGQLHDVAPPPSTEPLESYLGQLRQLVEQGQ